MLSPIMVKCILTLILQVLRNSGNDGRWKDAAVLANARTFHNGHVGAYPGAFPDFYVFVHHCEGVNLHIGADLGIGMDVG